MEQKLVPAFFLLALLSIGFESSGQLSRKVIVRNSKRISTYEGQRVPFSKRYNSIGFSISALNYYGDLSPSTKHLSSDISLTKPAFGLTFVRRYGPRYSLQGQFLYGTLSGSDASANPSDPEGHARYLRNLSFRNHIKELSIIAAYDFFENELTYVNRPKWTPYAYAGFALLIHNPEAKVMKADVEGNSLPHSGDWVSLRPLGTEGQYSNLDPTDSNYGIKPYSLMVIAIPFGIGSRFRLTELLDLSIEIGVRYTFTDYLDDVSRNYVDLGVLTSPLAKAMSYRSSELQPLTNPITYTGRDGAVYTVQNGYGQEQTGNMRGDKNANDVYVVTSVRLACIIPPSIHKTRHHH